MIPRRGTAGPARRSVPAVRGTAWRTGGATARFAARCVPAAAAGVVSPAVMRPVPAASALCRERREVQVSAPRRQRVAPVCVGTARTWRTPDSELVGGAFWPFGVGPFPLAPFPCPFPSPLAFMEAFGIGQRCRPSHHQCGLGRGRIEMSRLSRPSSMHRPTPSAVERYR